ncbi:uncharacterized protein LOC129588260 [Paramacrobiotus metropolitanus]|uniref:uncharacterized protein LOC129588260 n=1 Tax=Paramacrobiotus metropolitanus TaxID=2943436 RepID=UPI0024465186|nr:uncharacterized protein LOC129588260 [Paramacrobiotus metropolitanus]
MAMEKVIPVWHILSVFLPLPNIPEYGNIDKPKRTSSNIVTVIRFSKTVITCVILVTFFVHEAVNLVANRKDWEKYYVNANKIITLLTLMRCTVTSLKNMSAVLIFLSHMGRMKAYLSTINLLLANLNMSRARRHRHCMVGILMFMPFVILIPACCYFGVTFLNNMAKYHPDKSKVPFGIFRLDIETAFVITLCGDMFGTIIAVSIYVLIGTLARILKECCVVLNGRLRRIRKKAEADDAGFTYVTFQQDIHELRSLYEQIVEAYLQYEHAFSSQIVMGIVGSSLLMFASVSSFFKPNLTKDWIIAHALALIITFYAVVTLCFHPIQLHEESRRIIENLQTVIHSRQMRYLSKKNPAEKERKEEVDDGSRMEEYFSLFTFLQRTVTTPLVVSAGGFVELTRAFIISLIAMLIGFVLFLLEQYEGHKPNSQFSCAALLANRTGNTFSQVSIPEPSAYSNLTAITI